MSLDPLDLGVWAVVATPFTGSTLTVDEASLAKLVEHYARIGVTGLTVLGVFGVFGERSRQPEIARDDPASAVIADCSADPAASAHDPIGTNEIMTGNTAEDNALYHDAIDYLGTAGITMLFTQHTTIAHNDVSGMPYDGLTSGAWQGHVDNVNSAPAHSDQTTQNINSNNTISDNHSHNNMHVFTGDGGEIYTEGHQGGTVLSNDGSVNTAASYANGLTITGNVFDTNTPNGAYATAPDVGSQWINETGNVEWYNAHSSSCGWPTWSGSRLTLTHNWAADSDDSACSTDNSNTVIPGNPGPADLPHDVFANAGPSPAYQSVEAAIPARIDYSGSTPASGTTPAQVLVVGSGFTPSTPLTIGGVPRTTSPCSTAAS